MPVPKFDALMLPLLKLSSDGKDHRLNDVILPIANELGLSEADRAEQIPSGQSRLRNRIYWAKLYLSQAKAIDSVGQGVFRINDRGRELLSRNLACITPDLLTEYPEFVAFRAKSGNSAHKVSREDKDVTVVVPEDRSDENEETAGPADVRESHQIQALLAEIGSSMGMQIWLPRNDRASVLSKWKGDHPEPLDRLPLNYNEPTLKTIEQIDVLWLRGRSIRRAFEVEHTTAVYSGILRMADLLALQPNMDIKLHIVAPQARRDKVFQELRRPVFSLLERGPLAEYCTYLSYDSVRELREQPHLEHLKEGILDDYTEAADEIGEA
ncbi:MAG: winged helix-turn-helix domain-containing protein [Candidatus Tyrphobacter sp.]